MSIFPPQPSSSVSSVLAAISEIQQDSERPVTLVTLLATNFKPITPSLSSPKTLSRSTSPQPSSSVLLDLGQSHTNIIYDPFLQNFDSAPATSSNVASMNIQARSPIYPSTTEFSPEHVRPFPKAQARKTQNKKTKKKSTIYTDTPEKENIRIT